MKNFQDKFYEFLSNFHHDLIVGKNFLIYTFFRTAAQGAWFVIPLIVAKILNPNEFGIFSLSMMLVYLFSALTIKSFIQGPLVFFVNEEYRTNKKSNKTFTSILLLALICLIFSITVAVVSINQITKFANLAKYQVLYLGLAFLGINLRYFIDSLFMCINRRIEASIYMFILASASSIYIAILYFCQNQSLTDIFLIYFLPSIIISFIALKKINLSQFIPLDLSKKHTINIVSYSKWIIIGNTANYFINWGDNFVLRYYVTFEEIGNYNLGYQIFKGLVDIFIFASGYFTPVIIRNINNYKKIEEYLFNKRPKIMVFCSLIVILSYIIMPWLVETLFGIYYIKAAYVNRILLIGAVFALYTFSFHPILISLKKIKLMQLSSIFFLSFNLLMDYILVQFYGIYGAAIATSVTYFLMFVIYEFYFRKFIKKLLPGTSIE